MHIVHTLTVEGGGPPARKGGVTKRASRPVNHIEFPALWKGASVEHITTGKMGTRTGRNEIVGDSVHIVAFSLSSKGAMRTGQIDQSAIENPLRSEREPASVGKTTAGRMGNRTDRNEMVGDSVLPLANNLS